MKTKQNLVVVCIMVAMMQPFLFKAQSVAYRNSPSAKPEEKKVSWQAVTLNDKGTNVQNGVEFYTKDAKCSTKKVTTPEKTTFDSPHHHVISPDIYTLEPMNLVKLVNTNAYAVKVSYQTADFSPVVNVLVPPSTTIEGVCGTSDNNLAKLVILPPAGKMEEEKQKSAAYIKAHIVVSEIK